jgi:hypothetical protein
MNFFGFFAVVEMCSISYNPASLFRHSLYLSHRERKTKREGREATVTAVFVGEEGSRFRLKRKAGSSSERTNKKR